MLLVSVGVDKGDIARLETELARIPGGARKALVSALNKTATGVRTDVAKAVTRVYNVKQADAKKAVERLTQKATPAKPEVHLRVEGRTIRLYKFGARPNTPVHPSRRGGVRITVKKGQTKVFRHGFIARFQAGHDGHFGLFVRAPGATRRKADNKWGITTLPIVQQYGPSIPSMVKDAGAFKEIQTKADERLGKNIDHEIGRTLKGYGN